MKKRAHRREENLHNRKMTYMTVDTYPSKPGGIAIIMSIVGYAMLLLLFLLSFLQKGAAGMWIGFAGLMLFVEAVAGIGVGIYALQDSDAERSRSIVGLVANIMLMVVIVLLYIKGRM